MATYTTNLNLEKPATSENFNLSKINSNWEKIDSGWGTLNGRIIPQKVINDTTSATSRTYSIVNGTRFFIVGISGFVNQCFEIILLASSAGVVSIAEIHKGANVTLTTSVNNKLTVTFNNSSSLALYIFSTSTTNINGFTLD